MIASPLTDDFLPSAEFLLTCVPFVAYVHIHLEAERVMRTTPVALTRLVLTGLAFRAGWHCKRTTASDRNDAVILQDGALRRVSYLQT